MSMALDGGSRLSRQLRGGLARRGARSAVTASERRATQPRASSAAVMNACCSALLTHNPAG
jgi:hypothetical protein